jgi:hypothetical protein
VAAGSGVALPPAAERLAAVDELVAAALPRLVRLGALAMTGNLPEEPSEPALGREAAALVRLLDRALTTHGRDEEYDVAAWREHALTDAYAIAGGLPAAPAALSVLALAESGASSIAWAVMRLRRDRFGVAEALAAAIAPLLLIYASTVDPSG